MGRRSLVSLMHMSSLQCVYCAFVSLEGARPALLVTMFARSVLQPALKKERAFDGYLMMQFTLERMCGSSNGGIAILFKPRHI